MVEYVDESVLPLPRAAVWKLLEAHADDATIHRIHPLVLSQKTEATGAGEYVVARTIDARGRHLASRWKVTAQPPDRYRWEILDGPGPWAPGSFVENRYSDDPSGTRISTRGDLRISVLPFFLPQRGMIRRVLATTHDEDVAFGRAMRPAA